MAVLVFYGGAGINVISYCCKECRSAGVEALLNDKCCEIHNHSHAHVEGNCSESSHPAHTENNCCDSGHPDLYNSLCDHSSGDNCNMERIDFDWNSQNADELQIDLSPIAHDLFSNNLFNNPPTHLSFICENNTVMPNGPPLVLPRDYLSVLTVLLI